MSFNRNKYQVIRGAVSRGGALAYSIKISAEADYWMLENGVTQLRQ